METRWSSVLPLMFSTGGIFTLRKRFEISFDAHYIGLNPAFSELDFFYQNGASHIFPERGSSLLRYYVKRNSKIFFKSHRDDYVAPIPIEERKDIVLAYHAQLNSVDDETRIKAAKAWSKWEYVPWQFMRCSLRIQADDWT